MEEDFLVEAGETQIENEALKSRIRKLECITTCVNQKLAETMCENDDEKAASEKSLKQEIKQWKRELGTERKLRINLEKKVSNLTNKLTSFASPNLSPASPYLPSTVTSNDSPSPVTSCNICAEPISDYIPRFFLDNEINPACASCYKHSDDAYDSEAKPQTVTNSSFEVLENPSPDPSISTYTNHYQNFPIGESMTLSPTSLPQNLSLQISKSDPTRPFPFPPCFPPHSRTTTPCTVTDFPPQRKPLF